MLLLRPTLLLSRPISTAKFVLLVRQLQSVIGVNKASVISYLAVAVKRSWQTNQFSYGARMQYRSSVSLRK